MNPDIQIGDIQQELMNVQGQKRSREQTYGCLFNLIVYSPSEKRRVDLEKILQSITVKFPCRIIFIENDERKDENYLRVNVSSGQEGKTQQKVVSEFIRVATTKQQHERVPFLILPLIMPDVPIYLLWADDPSKECLILPELLKIATRLIFNSRWCDDLHRVALFMLNLLSTNPIDIMDMTWAYLNGWRKIIAKAFDTPSKIADLKQIKDVKISYQKESLQDTYGAIFLQGWLAAQLQWKFLTEEVFLEQKVLAYSNSVHDISVRLDPKGHEDILPGRISGVEFTTSTHNSYVLAKESGGAKVLLRTSTATECELPCTMQLPDPHRGYHFIKEIFYRPSSHEYADMLKQIVKLNLENF